MKLFSREAVSFAFLPAMNESSSIIKCKTSKLLEKNIGKNCNDVVLDKDIKSMIHKGKKQQQKTFLTEDTIKRMKKR